MDEEELNQLKNFVIHNLEDEDAIALTFESGRTTNKANLAPIIQIALALKKMTLGDNEEEEKSDEDEAYYDWVDFCNNQLNVFEVKWTKRLEDYGEKAEEEHTFMFRTTPRQVADNESRRYQKDEDENQEELLDSMLKNGAFK